MSRMIEGRPQPCHRQELEDPGTEVPNLPDYSLFMPFEHVKSRRLCPPALELTSGELGRDTLLEAGSLGSFLSQLLSDG